MKATTVTTILILVAAITLIRQDAEAVTQNVSFDITPEVSCGELIESTRLPEKVALFPGLTINIHIIEHDRCPNIGAQVIHYPGRTYVDMVFRKDQMYLTHILHETYHVADYYLTLYPENNTPEGRAYLYTNLFETVVRGLTK